MRDIPWQAWALASAGFAALTAIFGKIGVESIGSDLATLIRTVIILCLLAAILAVTRQWQPLDTVPGRTWLFLGLSGLATGGSWLCYYRALKAGPVGPVASLDKMSVLLVAVFGAAFLGEHLSLKNWLGVALIGAGAVLVSTRTGT